MIEVAAGFFQELVKHPLNCVPGIEVPLYNCVSGTLLS